MRQIIFLKIKVCAAVFVLFLGHTAWASSRDSLLNGLGANVAGSYVSPVAYSIGDAFNMGWISRFPSKKHIDMGAKLTLNTSFSWVGGARKNFEADTKMPLDRPFADQVAQNVDFSYAPSPALRDSARESFVQALIQKQGGFQVAVFGPTIVGSADDKIKIVLPADSILVRGKVVDSALLKEKLSSASADTVSKYNQLAQDPSTIPLRDSSRYVAWKQDTILTSVGGLFDQLFKELGDQLAGAPAIYPQLSVGSLYGAQFALRLAPRFKIPELGIVSYHGWSAQYDLFHFVADSNLALTVNYATQEARLGKLLAIDAEQFGVHLMSKFKIWPITKFCPYYGVSFDRSRFAFNLGEAVDLYQRLVDGKTVESTVNRSKDIEFETDWIVQHRIGFLMSLLKVVDLQAEYKAGETNAAMISLGFSL